MSSVNTKPDEQLTDILKSQPEGSLKPVQSITELDQSISGLGGKSEPLLDEKSKDTEQPVSEEKSNVDATNQQPESKKQSTEEQHSTGTKTEATKEEDSTNTKQALQTTDKNMKEQPVDLTKDVKQGNETESENKNKESLVDIKQPNGTVTTSEKEGVMVEKQFVGQNAQTVSEEKSKVLSVDTKQQVIADKDLQSLSNKENEEKKPNTNPATPKQVSHTTTEKKGDSVPSDSSNQKTDGNLNPQVDIDKNNQMHKGPFIQRKTNAPKGKPRKIDDKENNDACNNVKPLNVNLEEILTESKSLIALFAISRLQVIVFKV